MALLNIDDLGVYYKTKRGINKAVDGVSLRLDEGQSIGIVGESGCGKSTLARATIRVMSKNAYISKGRIDFQNQDLVKLSESQMREIRWTQMAMVPQAAMDSLNPVYTVANQFREVLALKGGLNKKARTPRAEELFRMVALDPHYLENYPHEFSGGMKQRAVIAMAFSLNPKLLITDEPVTALDVIVQNQVLKELRELQRRFNVALIMITHDISVVAHTCSRIAVMYAGKILEQGPTKAVLKSSLHPYTMGLANAFPNIRRPSKELISIEGSPPDLVDPPIGCRFAQRCPFVLEVCKHEEPLLLKHTKDHFCACHRLEEVEILRVKTKDAKTWRQVNI